MRAEYAQAAPEEQEVEVGGECQGLIDETCHRPFLSFFTP